MKPSLKTQNSHIAKAMQAKSLTAKAANGKAGAPVAKPAKASKAKPTPQPTEPTIAPEPKKRAARRPGTLKAKVAAPAPAPTDTPAEPTPVPVVEPTFAESLAEEMPAAPVVQVSVDKAEGIAQQIVIRAGALKAALKQVDRARGKNATLPVLSHILVETIDQDALRFTATDLDFALWHLSAAKVITHGAVCLPDILSDLLAKVNDDLLVTLTTDKKTWTTKVEAGRLTTHLKAADPSEFPPATSYNGKTTFLGADMTHESVTEITKRIVPFASTEDARPVLQGVHMRGTCPKESGKNATITFASADGFRLSVLERDVTLRFDADPKTPAVLDVIVPARAFAETLKVATDDAKPIQFLFHLQYDTKGVLERGMLQVETHAGGLRMNLLTGNFPDFNQIIPNPIPPLPHLPLAVEATLGALSRASLISESSIARFTVEPDHIRVSASSEHNGESVELIPTLYDPERKPAPNFEIAFNAGFLSDAIRAAAYGDGAKPVQLKVDKPSTPGYITLPRFVHVLMPMNVSGTSAKADTPKAQAPKTETPAPKPADIPGKANGKASVKPGKPPTPAKPIGKAAKKPN